MIDNRVEIMSETDSVNETGLAAGKEQVNETDSMVLDFLWSLAEEQGFKRFGGWKDWGCNKKLKADKGKVLFVFDGRFYPPKVRTERGEYDLGGMSGEYVNGTDVKMKPFFDTMVNWFPGLTEERGYAIPASDIEGRGHTPWGPVLSIDIGEILLFCQQVGGGKRNSL